MREFVGTVSEHPFLCLAVVAVSVTSVTHVVAAVSRGLSRVMLARTAVTQVVVQVDGTPVASATIPKLEERLAASARKARVQ